MVLALVAAGFCVVVLAFFFFAQESFIFPAPPRNRPMPPELLRGPGFTALWYPPPRAGAPVVVHFHGNGEDLADTGPVVDLYRSLEMGVLAVETPGYGVAAGKPSERALYESADAALRWL